MPACAWLAASALHRGRIEEAQAILDEAERGDTCAPSAASPTTLHEILLKFRRRFWERDDGVIGGTAANRRG